jgi:hypothetical protein
MGGRLGVLKPMRGDFEKRCPFSADFGDILLAVIRHIIKIRTNVIIKYYHIK